MDKDFVAPRKSYMLLKLLLAHIQGLPRILVKLEPGVDTHPATVFTFGLSTRERLPVLATVKPFHLQGVFH